ncbi:MAG: ABC transporter permease, partial [Casimicrobiaceae bacterium]
MDHLVPILAAAIAAGTPLVFAALGELVTEKSGVLNLGVEGMMLVGAFTAVLGSLTTGSPWLGAVAGILGGLLVGAAQALLSVRALADQIVVGVAANALALAATTFGARLWLS